MRTVISLVLAILLCELLSVSTLQNNMTTQAGNFVEAQAGTNANVVNEWLVEDGNIVHTIRNGVAFMNTKDTDQIMDYLEVNLAKDYKNDAGYYAEVSTERSKRYFPCHFRLHSHRIRKRFLPQYETSTGSYEGTRTDSFR